MNRNTKINALLLLVVAALAVLPLALGLGDHKEEPFTGSDGEAETAITEIEPDYEPWFSPLYEPPSGEIESAMFSLQAALGAGVLSYYFGIHRGRRQGEARARAELDGAGVATADGTSEALPVSATVAAGTAAVTATAAAKTPPGDEGSSAGSGESPTGRV
ncbi:energy-coupling factor ABC transporter substrate-binding protein [Streptomyces europaeiscabiei]|uniref:energy-coupling factor ABC transporter substrate-binding protein n=1 Tax=Streptomyces europaeiscabiei TaxID=146819 RepID=UPI0029B46300|nr:energy-coupling factor ABC transporter substrate-binding protein [Streptomyces europaeiscabiei]MDX3695441.1 energy-coupling factor ABC transporter substrate-binding protein [Streptomyces europaeiscabiei]